MLKRQSKTDSTPKDVRALPPFVATVGDTPASFIQASYLVGGKVVTFQWPLLSLEDAGKVAEVLVREVATTCRR